MTTEKVKIIECPRDAWQGLAHVIPTEAKVAYLERLIELGFRHLDAVSFVAPKYVPQMADSEEVMRQLAVAVRPDLEVIGIVVNQQGLERALGAAGLTTIGYPYSVSANFRRQNANMSQAESRALAAKLLEAARNSVSRVRKLVVYVSMAFGNHYGEPWSQEVTEEALLWLKGMGAKEVSLADTVGTAKPEEVGDLFRAMLQTMKDSGGVELGVHLHSRPEGAADKVLAAYEAGCRRFDSALTGLGGCPFAGDELVGNIPTEIVVSTLAARGVETGIEPWALLAAVEATQEIRRQYAS